MATQIQSEFANANITATTEISPEQSALANVPRTFNPIPINEKQYLELATEKFEHYAAFGVSAPQPDRDGIHFDHLAYPYCSQYAGSDLTEEPEHRMRQAFDLQVWLSMDALVVLPPVSETHMLPESGYLTSVQLANRRQGIEKKRDALLNFQSIQVDRLNRHVTLTQALFSSLRLVSPTDMCTTALPQECLALMKKASIEMPKKMNPLELYKALSKRLLVQEREVVEVGLELLRDQLQLVRMGFYAETGDFLRAQAQSVMAQYHKPENEPLLDSEDEIYKHLAEVLDEPIHTMWPAPVQPDNSDFMGLPHMICPGVA